LATHRVYSLNRNCGALRVCPPHASNEHTGST
jgi:hypothetical protein